MCIYVCIHVQCVVCVNTCTVYNMCACTVCSMCAYMYSQCVLCVHVCVHTCTVCSMCACMCAVCSMCAYMYAPYLRKALHVNTFAQAEKLFFALPSHFISLIWSSGTSSVSGLGQQPTLITLSCKLGRCGNEICDIGVRWVSVCSERGGEGEISEEEGRGGERRERGDLERGGMEIVEERIADFVRFIDALRLTISVLAVHSNHPAVFLTPSQGCRVIKTPFVPGHAVHYSKRPPCASPVLL